jgi:hypothetical protein
MNAAFTSYDESAGLGEAVLVFHGGRGRMVPSAHGAWLAGHCPDAELWLRPDDGRVSILGSCGVAALDWLVAQA